MAAPTVQTVTPGVNATDVVLGTQIFVTFDQIIDTTTVTESTFSLTGPGQTQILTPGQLVAEDPEPITGREYITGTFSFDNTSGKTVVTFNPSKPLQPNLTYTVQILGAGGLLTSDTVKNLSAEAMASTYRWSFTTGDLTVTTPPPSAPLPDLIKRINPNDIKIIPRAVVGNDLSQEIDIIFPGDIDPNSFSMDDVLIAIEAIIGDPSVTVPGGLTASGRIDHNKLIITITGWPLP